MTYFSTTVTLDETPQLPADYRPNSIRVCFDGVEAFQVIDGQTYPNPQYRKPDRKPNLLEMYWDQELVYVCTQEGVKLNRLKNVVTHAIQYLFDLDNF